MERVLCPGLPYTLGGCGPLWALSVLRGSVCANVHTDISVERHASAGDRCVSALQEQGWRGAWELGPLGLPSWPGCGPRQVTESCLTPGTHTGGPLSPETQLGVDKQPLPRPLPPGSGQHSWRPLSLLPGVWLQLISAFSLKPLLWRQVVQEPEMTADMPGLSRLTDAIQEFKANPKARGPSSSQPDGQGGQGTYRPARTAGGPPATLCCPLGPDGGRMWADRQVAAGGALAAGPEGVATPSLPRNAHHQGSPRLPSCCPLLLEVSCCLPPPAAAPALGLA